MSVDLEVISNPNWKAKMGDEVSDTEDEEVD